MSAAFDLECFLDRLVAAGGPYSSLALALGGAGGGELETFVRGEAAAPNARYDLASLTKPFVASLALVLDADGTLPLAARVGELWPEARPALAAKSLEDLLRHRSGLAAWTPLYARCPSAAAVPELLSTAEDLHGAAPGTYSDLGYILWGLAAERAAGKSLAGLLEERLFAALRIRGRIGPSPGPGDGALPCLADGAKEAELAGAEGIALDTPPAPRRGEPQDGNARFLGGLAGHAGLFAEVGAVARLAEAWVRLEEPLTPGAVARALAGGTPRVLGWARRSALGIRGPALSLAAYGHLGFTGGAVWVEPEGESYGVLLAHRRSATSDLGPARRELLRLAAARR